MTKSVERTVYSVLDWLGDVGGLFDAFNYIVCFLLSSTRLISFQVWLTASIQRLNKFRGSEVQSGSGKSNVARATTMREKKKAKLKTTWDVYLRQVFPSLMCCCKRTDESRFFDDGMERVKRELDIGNFMKK